MKPWRNDLLIESWRLGDHLKYLQDALPSPDYLRENRPGSYPWGWLRFQTHFQVGRILSRYLESVGWQGGAVVAVVDLG
jgi:hypothetical protein